MISVSSSIEKIISGKNLIENNIGESGAKVYKIESLTPNENGYLKIQHKESLFGVNHEFEVFKFLSGKVKVPKVISYDYPYLITTEIKGVCSFHVEESKRFHTVKLIAKALKELHSLDIKNCGLYSEFEHELRSNQYTASQLATKPEDDYVFVHGDACLPNFIIYEDKFNGFIDMGTSGIGNRYEDLAYCTWSILYNFKDEKYVNAFFSQYGEEYYCKDKINFYIKYMVEPSTNILPWELS